MLKTNSETVKHDLLSSLQIAAPCNVSWESMDGDERVRHCGQCTKNVYNISSMTRSEANRFLQATAHQACVNFYKRHDGTIITDNCPVGLRKIRAQYRKVASIIGTAISLLQGVWLTASAGETGTDNSNGAPTQQLQQIPNNVSGNLVRVPLGGKPVAHPNNATQLQGQSVQMAGSPPAMTSSETHAADVCREQIKSILFEDLPNEDLGHAAITLNVSSNGQLDNIKLINRSPDKATDDRIIKALNKAKLSPLPSDYHKPVLFIYYECR